MADLDDVLREGLRAMADPPPGDGAIERITAQRRRRRRTRAVGRVAVVGLVLGGVFGTIAYVSDDGRSEVATEPNTDESPTAERQLQAVSYHGIEVWVPKAWQLNHHWCGTPQSDTVMVWGSLGGIALCHVVQPPGLTVVHVYGIGEVIGDEAAALATTDTLVDGAPARRGTGSPGARRPDLHVLVIPSTGVVIAVESPDPALAEQILDDVRLAPIDGNGCPSEIESLEHPPASGVPGAAELLVPGTPSRAVLCRYSDLRLSQSAPALTGASLDELMAILNALPPGTSQPGPEFQIGCDIAPDLCAAEQRRGFVVTFEYPTGERLPVHVRIAGAAEMSAANGDRVTKLDQALITFLVDRLHYDFSYPDPRTLR